MSLAMDIVDCLLPNNTKRRLLFDMMVVLVKDPHRLISNLTIQNVRTFANQFNSMQPDTLAAEVKNKIYSYQSQKLSKDKYNYFGLFETACDPRKLLVIDRFMPAYDTNSGALRMFTILNILNELGYKVTFMPDDLQPKEPYKSELENAGIEVVCGNINLEDYFRENGPKFSYVILSEPQPAYNFISFARAYAINSTIIYDTVDLHWVRLERAASVIKGKEILKEAEYFKKTETLNMMSSDLVLTVTEDEKVYLETINDTLNVEVLPNIHEVVSVDIKPFRQRKDIMFIGHFLHHPNTDAVAYFVKDVFPLIKKEVPDIKFYIVGSNPTKDVIGLSSDDVIVTGYVKDVAPYFQDCRVFVAPLRFGAGMKGKVGQSMTFGLPVVTTSIGAEGMGLVSGENVIVADNDQDFADAVLGLYTEEGVWSKISKSSMTHIDSKYSKKAISKQIAYILEKNCMCEGC